MTEPFSKRNQLRSAVPITVRGDAPPAVREALIAIAYREDLTPSIVRAAICNELLVRPDPGNWSDFPNVDHEVQDLLARCPWYRVYDIAEELHGEIEVRERKLKHHFEPFKGSPISFARRLNEFLEETGIGFKMDAGLIQYRGDQAFEHAVASAKAATQDHPTTQGEITAALRALSQRPDQDLTGAVQHAVAGLECVARDLAGGTNATLGEVLKRHGPTLGLKEPLLTGAEKLWGFASGKGRHLAEGGEPTAAEAELVVTIAGGLIAYLTKVSGT